jgi:hypothetical protein
VRIKSIMFGCLAAGLLIGAPQAMADPNVDSYLVVDVQSSSGEISVNADLCMLAVLELINEQNFELQSTSPVGGNGGPDLSSFVFTRGLPPVVDYEVATLFCIANIGDEEEGGMGGMGGMGLGDLDDPGGVL